MRYLAPAIPLLILALSLSACAAEASPEKRDTPRHTASAVFAAVLQSIDVDPPVVALEYAKKLVEDFQGTPEADSITTLLPALEERAAEAAKAELDRTRELAAAAEARRLADKWTYTSSVDPMTSRPSRSAAIRSENTVEFDFPYQGSQRGTLHVRDHPTYGRDVMLIIERGQFLCQSYEDCRVRVRFDEDTPRTWNAVGPADNSTTTIFLRNEAGFLQRMRNAKVVRIQARVYQEGEPVFEFHVRGYNHARFAGTQ